MDDEQPEVAIGHVVMHVSDVERSVDFYLKLGLRGSEATEPGMSLLELLGGTHLMLVDDDEMKQSLPASKIGATLPDREPDWKEDFELMVRGESREDLDAYHDGLIEKGLNPGPVEDGMFGHFLFQIDDPDGNTITVYSSHAHDLV